MNKAFIVITLAFSSLLFGCPDKPADGAKPAAAPSAAPAANAPGAPAPTTGGGGW